MINGGGSINELAIKIIFSGALLGILEMIVPNGKMGKTVSFAITIFFLAFLLSPFKNTNALLDTVNAGVDKIIQRNSLNDNELRESIEREIKEGGEYYEKIVDEESNKAIVNATSNILGMNGIEIGQKDIRIIGDETVFIYVDISALSEESKSVINLQKEVLERKISNEIAMILSVDEKYLRFEFKQ